MSDVPQGVNPSILVFQNEVTSALVPTPAPAAMILFTPAAGASGSGGSGGSAVWGGITGTLSDQIDLTTALGTKLDDVAAGADAEIVGANAAGTVLQRLGYTIATLLTAAYARASHTGTQLASTISDFASAAVAAVTWSTITGKPGTFDPSAHKTSHATGGADALTAADIGAATAAQGTDDRTASGLRTATTVVAVSSATAPSSGQVLTATSSTAATWQTPSSGGGSPGGSASELQYRVDGTTFGGMAGTAWDNTNRALTVTGATLTASAPILYLSQVWNNAAVAFTGFRLNVTNTASAVTSKVFDVQVGGTSQIYISPTGNMHFVEDDIYLSRPTANTLAIYAGSAATPAAQFRSVGIATIPTAYIGWLSTSSGAGSFSTGFYLDAGSVVAQRNGTNAQTLRVYGTWTDASNYVRAALSSSSTAVTLAAETAGTGADNVPVIINPGGTSQVEVGNGVQFTEMTAPSAPAANKVILFAQDNGAGKTQLMALFPSGAAQQVSIEP